MYIISSWKKEYFLYYYDIYIFSFLWKIYVSPVLIIVVMQYPVTKNDWWWMLWEDGRRQGNACSRNIMEWEGDLYQGWMFSCCLVMKCQGRDYKDIYQAHFLWLYVNTYTLLHIVISSKYLLNEWTLAILTTTYINRFYICLGIYA